MIEDANQQKLGGLNFYGPNGIGKSWSAMYLLWYLLQENEKLDSTQKKNVIYYDSYRLSAWVFGLERSVLISDVDPLSVIIPELDMVNSILIYDAAAGQNQFLPGYLAQYFIFASPNAGNYLHIRREKGIKRINCPEWTLEELTLLGDQFAVVDGMSLTHEMIEERYENFGGNPRLVVTHPLEVSQELVWDAFQIR